jgi:hypothetical protein
MFTKRHLVGILGLLIASLVFAETPPTYNRLLFSDDLQSTGSKSFASIITTGGSFVEDGWRSGHNTALRMTFNDELPAEGSVTVRVSGLMPTVSNDWVPISLWSRRGGGFRDVDPTAGSYTFIKTEENQIKDGKQYFALFTSAYYGGYPDEDNRTKTYQNNPPAWQWNQDYEFKIVWNTKKLWWLLNDQVIAEHNFYNRSNKFGQVEGFRYLYLGMDNEYSGMVGVIYKDVRIHVPDSDIRFKNVSFSSESMVDRLYGAQSVTWFDANNDGYEDLYVTYCDKVDQLYIQQTDGSFVEEGAARGIANPGCSFAGSAADYDSDGDMDLFITTYGGANRLLINDGNGYFADESALRGIESVDHGSVNALALDADRDQDLDIFLVNSNNPHRLYTNRGDGTFSLRVVSEAPQGAGSRAAVGDINLDGIQDIFYTRREDPCVLLIGDGNGGFTDMAASYGVDYDGLTLTPTLADLDNDADLDLIVTQNSTTGNPEPRLLIYENLGGTQFARRTDQLDIHMPAYGVLVGDFDNDGYQDIYVPTRNSHANKMDDASSRLYKNEGNWIFTEQYNTGFERFFPDARGSAAADYNQDGRLDAYIACKGGILKGEEYGHNVLFQNVSSTIPSYFKVSILDENGNLNGIGARVTLYQAGHLKGGANYVVGYREIAPWQGYQSQNSMVQHFGVGNKASVDLSVQLANGQELNYSNLQVNQHFMVSPSQTIPHRLNFVSGDQQTGQVDTEFSDSLIVRVTDEQGAPVAGHPVTFNAIAGGATINNTNQNSLNVSTDQYGLARAAIRAGTVPGFENTVIQISSAVDGSDLINSPVQVLLSVEPGPPQQLVIESGNNQTGSISSALPSPLVIRVSDSFDNPIPGHSVQFQVATGGGKYNGDQTTIDLFTNEFGLAQASWILGPSTGEQTVQVYSRYNGVPLSNSPVTFRATATQPQLKLARVSGHLQQGQINTQLASPLVVRLLNFSDQPVANRDVSFEVVSGGGHLPGNVQVLTKKTGADGFASVTPTLGTVTGDSNNVFQAQVPGAMGSPAVFKASALPGPAFSVALVSGQDQTGTVGEPLAQPLTVKVIDGFNNPVSGYNVLFRVSSGDANIDGLAEKSVPTDANGLASATVACGTSSGAISVLARADGLENSPVIFNAQSKAKQPAKLVKISGDGQRGTVGQPLASPFRVRVTDGFNNGISNHPVVFQVIQGGGRLNGLAQVTLQTDADGFASSTLVLGNTHYINEVMVSSQYLGQPLENSPLTFRATTGSDEPDSLLYVSGNNQVGRINHILPEPFVVKVTDMHGIPIEGHSVTFTAISSGANFGGQKSITIPTDSDGLAKALATIGSNIGNNNNVYEVRAYQNNVPLNGNPEWPIRFFASGRQSTGTQLRDLTANRDNLHGDVGSFLQDTLKVQVLDAKGEPAEGQPVLFEVTSGNSLLQGSVTTRSVASDENGIAQVVVKLGTVPGVSNVRVTANNGVAELENSPIDYTVTTLVGDPSLTHSTISSDSLVTANGQQAAKVNVVLRDPYRNPVPGKTVILYAEGLDVTIVQPTDPSDADGSTQGSLYSIHAGIATVFAMVDGQIIPDDSVRIRFKADTPSQVTTFGSGQVALMGKMVPDSIGVIVRDQFGNPVKDVQVNFRVKSGGGSLTSGGPFYTDAQGIASVNWTLGVPGEQFVEATVPGVINNWLKISAIAITPEPEQILAISGDKQIGQNHQKLPQPLIVQVKDAENRPIPGITVTFDVTQGDGRFLPSSFIKTNSEGKAQTEFEPGTKTGMHIIEASVNGLESKALFNIMVATGIEGTIEKISGDEQNSRPDRILGEPLVVRIVDLFSRPLANTSVLFEVIEGNGSLVESQPVMTNNNGVANALWRVGIQGNQRVKVSSDSISAYPVYFTATLSNTAPLLTVPADTMIKTNELLIFSVQASDPDGDAVTFGVRNLPIGASFDSTSATPSFTWRPTSSQTGAHTIDFVATDAYGAQDQKSINILVDVKNQLPVIESYSPMDTSISLEYGSFMAFSVQATDPDGDELQYEWTINGGFAGAQPTFSYLFSQDAGLGSDVLVQVRISDPTHVLTKRWHIKLSTAVELSLFEATEQNGLVELHWRTASETGNTGFYVLRSASRQGPWQMLQTGLIPPESDRDYSVTDENVQRGEIYFYKLQDLDRDGLVTEHGPVKVQVSVPSEIDLAQNYPNPFNPTTTISFDLPESQQLRLEIINITGQTVKVLLDGQISAGSHQVIWDATNRNGMPVPTGLYFYRMITESKVFTKKLLLEK